MKPENIIQKNIEEFRNNFMNNGIDGVLPDEFQDPQMVKIDIHLKQSYISFIKSEIDRLEIQYVNENPVDCIDGETPVETYGYEELENVVIKRQVDHYKEILKELNV